MSWLFLDSAERGRVRLAHLPVKGRIRTRTVKRPRTNTPLALAGFVSPAEARSITGVCVVAGPGSFSAVRSGVLVANVVARLLNKPLVGVSTEEAKQLPALRRRLAGGELNAVSYVAPVYDREPNITC